MVDVEKIKQRHRDIRRNLDDLSDRARRISEMQDLLGGLEVTENTDVGASMLGVDVRVPVNHALAFINAALKKEIEAYNDSALMIAVDQIG